MHFLDVLQKSDIMLLTMGKNMEGGGGGVAFSKHDRPWETKENWQVLYGSMQIANGWNCSYYRQNKILPMHQKLWRTKWFDESLLDATNCRNFSFQAVKTTINPKYEDAVWNMVITKWKLRIWKYFSFILNCFPIICNNMRLPFLFIVFRSSAISLLFSGKSTSKNWNEQGR